MAKPRYQLFHAASYVAPGLALMAVATLRLFQDMHAGVLPPAGQWILPNIALAAAFVIFGLFIPRKKYLNTPVDRRKEAACIAAGFFFQLPVIGFCLWSSIYCVRDRSLSVVWGSTVFAASTIGISSGVWNLFALDARWTALPDTVV